MQSKSFWKALFCFALVTASSVSADAMEIRFKPVHRCRNSLVRLSDVAEVTDADANLIDKLSRIELFLAPSQERAVSATEIKHILLLHSVDLTQIHFTGTDNIVLYPFDARRDRESESESAGVTNEMQPMIVVAVRPLQRGEIIQASHVELAPAPQNAQFLDTAEDVSNVVGKEALRTIVAGKPVETRYVRNPLLVRRGELITVLAYASGIRVRTRATAVEEGGRGELILVQTLDKKHKYAARVADFQTVELYAGPPQVDR